MGSLRVLAIDLGASNGRGIVGDFDGERLAISPVHSFPNRMAQIRGAWYWDIIRLYDETLTAMKRAEGFPGGPPSSVAIDGWAQDFGLLDREGNLLGNVHTYRDPYSAGMKEGFAELMGDEAFYARTGLETGGILSLFQLMGLREKEKAIYENAHTFLFVADLVKYFLTGEKNCCVTLAGLSGLFDIHEGRWSEEILGLAGLKRIFPPVSGTRERIGVIDVPGRASRIQLLSVATHDTASALSFIPDQGEGAFLISSGTWSGAGHALAAPETKPEALRQGLLSELGFDESIYLVKNLTGLWIEQELLRQWDLGDVSAAALRLEAGNSHYGHAFDTQSEEFAAPGQMEEKILAALSGHGHPLPEGRAAIYRCVMRSLACKYRDTIEAFEANKGGKFDRIHIVGGGSQNALLNQLTADICGRPVSAGPAEATAIGNIAGQLLALGEIKDVGQAREVVSRSFPGKTFLPGKRL